MPKRIQRKRTKGWRMPSDAVYVGRPSKWGNPWSPANATVSLVGNRGFKSSRPATIGECVSMFEEDVRECTFGYSPSDVKRALAGKDLACWCSLDAPCHADVLLEIANGVPPTGDTDDD